MPKLAFLNQPEYDEYFIEGIFAKPCQEVMVCIEKAEDIESLWHDFPDTMKQIPDLFEK